MADGGMAGLDGIISRLMADPGIMATVSEAVAGMKNSAPKDAGDAPDDDAETSPPAAPGSGVPDMRSIAELASILGGTRTVAVGGGEKKSVSDRKKRCDLLNALKPYLNSHRRETIDYMLGIERLGDALKTVKRS